MNHRRNVRIAACIVVLGLAAACSGSDGDGDRASLTAGYSNTRGKARQELRLASGEYDDLAFDLSWASFDSGELAFEALLAGSIDIQEVQPTTLVNVAGNSKDQWTADSAPVAVVGAIKYTTPEGIQIVVRPDSGIDSVADLKGKKVTFTRGSSSHYYLALKLEQSGLSLDDVEVVKLKLAEAKSAFAAGEVDAIVAFDFNILAITRTGAGRVIARSSQDAVPLYSLLVARRSLLGDSVHRTAINEMVRRSARFEEWVSSHVDQARSVAESVDALDPLDSETFITLGLAQYVPLSEELIGAVQEQSDVFHEQGVTANKIDVSVLFDQYMSID